MVLKTYNLFGSKVDFFLDSEPLLCEPLMEEAYEFALKLQKIFNVYDKNSEINLINNKKNILVSSEMIEVLSKALKLCKLSKGQLDISLGKQFIKRKNKKELPNLSCSYKDIEIIGNKVRLLHKEVWLDLGSIAKGYITDKIAEFFIEQGIKTGYIDSRGDLRVFGDEREIGIQHPRKDKIITKIKIKNKGVATSGDYNQYYGDYSKSHILNQKEIISITVVSKDLMIADAYATMLMVCDTKSRERIINQSKVSAMIIDKELNINYYNDFKNLIVK